MLRKTVQKLLDFRGWKLKDALHISNGPWFRILARSVAVGSYSVLTMVSVALSPCARVGSDGGFSACLILTFTPQGPAHDFVDMCVATRTSVVSASCVEHPITIPQYLSPHSPFRYAV